MKGLPRNSVGVLEAFAWPGGYQYVFYDKDGSLLCHTCAVKSDQDEDELPQFKPIAADIYWEGPDMECDGCNAKIESEYGDPSEEGK